MIIYYAEFQSCFKQCFHINNEQTLCDVDGPSCGDEPETLHLQFPAASWSIFSVPLLADLVYGLQLFLSSFPLFSIISRHSGEGLSEKELLINTQRDFANTRQPKVATAAGEHDGAFRARCFRRGLIYGNHNNHMQENWNLEVYQVNKNTHN